MATAAAAARSRRTRLHCACFARCPSNFAGAAASCGSIVRCASSSVRKASKRVPSHGGNWKVMSFHGTEEIHCTRMGRAGPGRHAQSARRGESDGQSSQRHRPVYTARTNRRILAGSEQQGAQPPLLPSIPSIRSSSERTVDSSSCRRSLQLPAQQLKYSAVGR